MRRPMVVVIAVAVGAGLVAVVASGLLDRDAPERGGTETQRASPRTADPRTGPTPGAAGSTDEEPGPYGIHGLVLLDRVPASATVEILRHLEKEPYAFEAEELLLCATVRAGDDGRFSVRGLHEGIHEVRATIGEARASRWVGVGKGQTWARTVVTVPGGSLALEGIAIWADRSAFRGEIGAILLHPESFELATLPAVETDREGRFRITGLSPGLVRLTARIPGKLRVTGPAWRVPARNEVVFVVDEGLTPVNGVVVADADGRPVPGAMVDGSESGEESLLGTRLILFLRSVTDAEGRFRHYRELLPAGVRAEGFHPASAVAPAEGEEIVVRLKPSRAEPRWGRICGRVLTADGTPVEGAVVLGRGRPVATGADGSYLLERVLFKTWVLVYGGGWVSRELHTHRGLSLESLTVEVGPETVAERDLVAVRTASVRGRVVDESGAPVPGTRVGRRWQWSPPRESRIWRWLASRSDRVVTPDEAGSFVLEGLIPGIPHEIRLIGAGGIVLTKQAVTAGPGEELDLVLVHPEERFVDVTVRFADTGEPAVGARVVTGGYAGFGDRTDRHGRVRVGPLPPGKCRLLAYHADAVDRHVAVEVEEAGATATFELERGHVVGGRVLTPDGHSARSASVYVMGAGGEHDFEENTVTAADGTFRFRGLPGGNESHELVAEWHRNGQGHEATLRAELDVESHELRLAPVTPRPFSGYEVAIVGPEGRPVVGATVRLWSSRSGRLDSRPRDAWVTKEGTARFGARGGDETVWIEVLTARSTDGPCAPALFGPIDIRGWPARIELDRPRALGGRIVGPVGEPVEGADIAALGVWPSLEQPAHRPPHGKTTTKANGTFAFEALANVEYDLVVKAPARYGDPAPVRVRAGAEDALIRLRRAAAVALRVVDDEDRPLSNVRVTLTRGTLAVFRNRTDASGTVRPDRLDPEVRYRLEVAQTGRIAETIEDWTPADRTIRLRQDLPIEGIVLEGGLAPTRWVLLLHRPVGEEKWRTAYSRKGGRFTLTRLPAGQVEVRVVPQGKSRDDPDLQTVTLQAGARDVELEVR